MVSRKIPHEYRQFPGGHSTWQEFRLPNLLEFSGRIMIPPISQVLSATIARKGIDSAIRQYREMRHTHARNYNFSEPVLNRLGYDLLRNQKATEAIEIFKLNVEIFPRSFNVYDSLAEAYLVNGNKEPALKNYERSLELNPQNTKAVEMLKKLRGN
ncbi:MAG: tetratricopeptide repeat protein [Pyrinomonadaceae bacterium]